MLCSSDYFYQFLIKHWPFSFLYPLERLGLRLFERKKEDKTYKNAKIFDIHSGEPLLSDDEFMDSLLARISKYGEEVLTPEGRKRMGETPERKSRFK
jgi:hypothetical protein